MNELSIIQKTYDLIVWYVPIISRLPRDHKFTLGDRITTGMYQLLEALIRAKYAHIKLHLIEPLNAELDILRYQTRLLLEFDLINKKRYHYVSKLLNSIGTDLGGWIKQRKQKE